MTDLEKAVFYASLAENSYPIKIKESITVVLEIPLSEMAEAIKLVGMQNKTLKVSIEAEKKIGNNSVKRTAAKRRNG